jgi:YqxM protein
MKKLKKITVGIITASLLAAPFVQDTTFAATKQNENAKVSIQKGLKNKSGWDRSSLSFMVENVTCNGVSATIKNGQDSRDTQGEMTYELYYAEKGNPKRGEAVATGVIHALSSGETQELTYTPDQLVAGNYMFKAYQSSNHPGKGVLWSESITVTEEFAGNEPIELERPLDQFFNSDVTNGTATFTVPEEMDPIEISFTSYTYPEGTVLGEDGKPYEGQTSFDNVTDVYGPGTYTIEIDLPEGDWQTDLYVGSEIEILTECGHPIHKIIDADYSAKQN